MTLSSDELIRRGLLHVLRPGFHRIRHCGLLAGSARNASLPLARKLLDVATSLDEDKPGEPEDYRPPCSCWDGHVILIEVFARCTPPRGPPDTTATNRETSP